MTNLTQNYGNVPRIRYYEAVLYIRPGKYCMSFMSEDLPVIKSNSPPLWCCGQMPHPKYIAVHQTSPSPGKGGGQMPGLCPAGELYEFRIDQYIRECSFNQIIIGN